MIEMEAWVYLLSLAITSVVGLFVGFGWGEIHGRLSSLERRLKIMGEQDEQS